MMRVLVDGRTVSLLCHPELVKHLKSGADAVAPQVGEELAAVKATDPLDRLEAEMAAASAQSAIDEAVQGVNDRAAALLDSFTPAGDLLRLDLNPDDTATLAMWANAQYVRLRRQQLHDCGSDVVPGQVPSLLDELGDILGESTTPEVTREAGMWAEFAQILSTAVAV